MKLNYSFCRGAWYLCALGFPFGELVTMHVAHVNDRCCAHALFP